MPTILGDPFLPCKVLTPPGMSSFEIMLWHRFQVKYCEDWSRVFYNVRVGKGSPPPGHYEEEIKEMWLFITMHRIDALVETAGDIILIEVRGSAGRSALGACILYKQLYEQDRVIQKPIRLAVVTNFLNEEMEGIFKNNGIETYIV
jgi:hypothetical protein